MILQRMMHDATSLARIDIDDVNEQDEVTLSRSVDVRVSNRILARVNASAADAAGAEIMVNVRPAVVSPHVRRAQVDQEETNDAVAAAVGGRVPAQLTPTRRVAAATTMTKSLSLSC